MWMTIGCPERSGDYGYDMWTTLGHLQGLWDKGDDMGTMLCLQGLGMTGITWG